jgi:membrane peptidoglycan carboxypeptidase
LIRPAGPPQDDGYSASRRASRPDDGRPTRAPRRDGYGENDTGAYSTHDRSMGDRARDFSRSMSRQLSSMMESARGAMRGRRSEGPDQDASGYAPSVAMGAMGGAAGAPTEASSAAYRRSRLRLRARKWRMGRHNPHAMWYAIGFAMSAALLVALVGAGTGGAYYAISYYNQHLNDIASVASSAELGSTTIYDRNGNILYTVPKSTGVNIYLAYGSGGSQGDIGTKVVNATVATEDHTFWDSTNIGIDWTSILRAASSNASSGGAGQGGSGITQQLVKRLVLHDPSKNLQRKINEAILSVGITTSGTYPKWKILEMYLNTIDYSDGNLGIEAAAENYFGIQPIKDATKCGDMTFSTPRTCWANQQLDWAQVSMLAGIPNSPTAYNPARFSCQAPNGKTLAQACPDSTWDNPCIGDPNNLLNANCFPDGLGPDNYHYSTSGHEWLSYRRASVVLSSLESYGYINDTTYHSSLNEVHDILVNHKVGSHLGGTAASTFGVTKLAPHFVDYILNEVLPAAPFNIQDPQADGLKVYTTLDLNLDEYAIKRAQYYILQPHTLEWPNYAPGHCGSCMEPSLSDSANIHNTAIVAMDPHNGDILAMVGSVDYTSRDPKVNGFYNVATSGNRSMGSSTKPLVYATAFQMGWNPGTMLQDSPVCYPNPVPPVNGKPDVEAVTPGCSGVYVPHNYDPASFSGHLAIRYALANSLNVPATETMEFVGATPATSDAFMAEAQRMGVTSLDKNAIGPSTALGTQNISLLQLTNAYGVFADQGKHVSPRSVLEIVDAYGVMRYKASDPTPAQVLSPQAAYEMTSILTDSNARIPDFNFSNPLEFDETGGNAPDNQLGFPAVAGKTGTSQGINGPRDIVTMGYSPYMALGVWAGNSDSSDLHAVIGIAGAGYIFHDIMEYAIKTYKWPKGTQFPIPPDMARGVFNCTTGLAPYAATTTGPCPVDPNSQHPIPTYAGYGYQPQPNTDWYIQGQPWVHS